MGKGKIPLYSWWKGQKLDYINARKQIYVPLYSQVADTHTFLRLNNLVSNALEKMRMSI